MSDIISFDSDAVNAAVQTITREVDTINDGVTKFMRELTDKNVITSGKFPLLAKLQTEMNQDVEKIKALNTTLEDVRVTLNKYLELAEEVADGSCWDNM